MCRCYLRVLARIPRDRSSPRILGTALMLAGAFFLLLGTTTAESSTAGRHAATGGSPVVQDTGAVQNERAQTEYYTELARKAREPKPWWDMAAPCGAVLAALVALVSFFFNYDATLRHRRDTQFYEALRRLGDPSPAVRIGSTGLLGQMAAERRWLIKRPYLDIALQQLVAGSLVDSDSLVLMHIRKAIGHLAPTSPASVIKSLMAANLELQYSLVENVASYCGWRGAQGVDDVPVDVWEVIVAATAHYDRPVIDALVRRHGFIQLFEDRLTLASHSLALGHTIRYCGARDMNLMYTFLAGVDLHGADLVAAVLSQAFLQGADLRDTRLRGTKLAGVHFDEHTHFARATWWSANFYEQDGTAVPDESLLRVLARQDTLRMLEHRDEAHPSVRQFCHQSVAVAKAED